MKTSRKLLFALPVFFLVACNWGHEVSVEDSESLDSTSMAVDSSIIMHNDAPLAAMTGVGPIKDKVELEQNIDKAMAERGEKLFQNNCATCHEIHESARGPALGGVLDKRSPQWVMNMILNPREMVEEDPQARALKAVYETQMVDLDLSQKDAREIVEYLRTY